MSIENHEFGDGCIRVANSHKDFVRIRLIGRDKLFHLNKLDALAIAKHFKIDRESLSNDINELIDRTYGFSDLNSVETLNSLLIELKQIVGDGEER